MRDVTETGERTLSDADVEAIAEALESKLTDRVVKGAGTGALQFLKRLAFWAILGACAYAIAHGFRS